MSAPASPFYFNEEEFKTRVQNALNRVSTVLEHTKMPVLATPQAEHVYEDKYALAEFMVNCTVASLLHVLEQLGLSEKQLAQLRDWAKTRSVTLRLKAAESCKFLRKATREVKSDTKVVSESTLFGKSEHYAVTKVTEWFWQFDVRYELLAFQGNEPEKNIVLQQKHGSVELKTSSESTPHPENRVRDSVDLNLSWLLAQLNEKHESAFRIERAAKSCHTPRRNEQVDHAIAWCAAADSWARAVYSYLVATLFPVQPDHGLDLSAVSQATGDSAIFVPILPLFSKPHHHEEEEEEEEAGEEDEKKKEKKEKKEKKDKEKEKDKPLTRVPLALVPSLVAEEKRSAAERLRELEKVFPANGKLVTQTEAKIAVLALHLARLVSTLSNGLDYIESMLFKQLVAAIGKEVSPVDFTNYMRYHARKLYREEYQPRPFCYAVRRADHTPEGALSIEQQLGAPPPELRCPKDHLLQFTVPTYSWRCDGCSTLGSNANRNCPLCQFDLCASCTASRLAAAPRADAVPPEPIHTLVAWSPSTRPFKFALDAATNVQFGGDRFVHGFVMQQFAGNSGTSLSLVARARQFSSFIVLLGTITGADTFDPKYGMIVQNKDDLRIPLNLETIPSAKEFRDAIESLSPEQQRFAKAYRSMQLESTLFGVVVIQIKPQLEKLLNLPSDALTKEIQLTQDLMSLFIEYQVPSDLLSYGGHPDQAVGAKVQAVKDHVSALQETIKKNKATALTEARQESSYRRAEGSARPTTNAPVYGGLVPTSLRAGPVGGAPGGGGRGGGGAVRGMALPLAQRQQQQQQQAQPSPKPQATTTTSTSSPVAAAKLVQQAPAQQPPAQQQQRPSEPPANTSLESVVDYTKIPFELDSQLERLDVDAQLRPTIVTAGSPWTKGFQKTLLSPPESKSLDVEGQKTERQQCFDLLDALTRSGSLAIEFASLHVFIASTHCFGKSVMNTVVQDNVNPIEKLERSSLIVAAAIHHVPPEELINEEHKARIAQFNPQLLSNANVAEAVAVKK